MTDRAWCAECGGWGEWIGTKPEAGIRGLVCKGEGLVTMTEREQMRKLANDIRTALDHGYRAYNLQGAQLDWVIVALRKLANAHGERGTTDANDE